MGVRIIATPPGEAPLAVREAWCGLVLPIVGEGPSSVFTQGVLTGPRGCLPSLAALLLGRFKRELGYRVVAAEAITILGASRPEAAAWWRENTPDLLQAGRLLIFHAHVCELLEVQRPERIIPPGNRPGVG
jgi:hypothetical protein